VKRTLGYEAGGRNGDNVIEYVHPEDKQRVSEALTELIENPAEKTERIEFRFEQNDGSYLWMESIGVDRMNSSIEGIVVNSRDISRRKKQEKRVKETTETLQAFTKTFPDLALIIDEEGNFLDWFGSEQAEALHYDGESDFNTKVTVRDTFEENLADQAIKKVRKAIESGELQKLTYQLETKTGAEWFEARIVGIERNAEEKSTAVWVTRNISERIKRERSLREFRKAIEQTAHAVYITDTEGNIEYVNPAFEEITGFESAEVVGQNARLLQSGKYDAEFYEELWDTILAGETWANEMINKNVHGDEIVLDQTIAPIFDEHGDPEKFVAVAQDITRKKEYENELEKTQKLLREVLDIVPDPIFVRRSDGTFLIANKAEADLYGMEPDELEGQHEMQANPNPSQAEMFLDEDQRVIESNKPEYQRTDEVNITGEDTKIHQVTKIPFELPETEEKAILGYARDITDLKAHQKRLEDQRNNLKVLNEIIRHDIRNNLQLILAYSETIQNQVENEAQDYVSKIFAAAEDSVRITEEAKQVTEVMLRSDVASSEVDLRESLRSEIEEVRSQFVDAKIEVEGEIPDVDVAADDMLGSVFRNLLENGCQHSEEEHPYVKIGITVSEDSVEVSFADNGPGVPDENVDEIFQQGEKGLESDGTGMGLYIVQSLLDRYDGDIRVNNLESGGAKFTVTLPRTR
jgi:PAS domain S-box-containing protein